MISALSRIELTNSSLFRHRLLCTKRSLICSHLLDRCTYTSVHLRMMFRRGRQSLWHRNTSTWRYAYRHSGCIISSSWHNRKFFPEGYWKSLYTLKRSHLHLQLLQNVISSPVPELLNTLSDTSLLSFFKFTSRLHDVVIMIRLSLFTASWELISDRGKGLNWVSLCDPIKVTRESNSLSNIWKSFSLSYQCSCRLQLGLEIDYTRISTIEEYLPSVPVDVMFPTWHLWGVNPLSQDNRILSPMRSALTIYSVLMFSTWLTIIKSLIL